MNKIAKSGFTLVEMLVVVTILGIIATVSIPLMSSNDPQKLNVAAEETANVLRLALSEASRTNGYVLVDGKAVAGHFKLYYSNSSGNLTTAFTDPLTKRTLDIDITTGAFSSGVTVTPQFMAGGSARKRLLIGPGLTQMQGFDSATEGALQANSGVLLTLGNQSVFVGLNQNTGLVTLP